MVTHQYIPMNGEPVRPGGAGEQLEHERKVVAGAKQRLAVCASLDDVMGLARYYQAGQASHVVCNRRKINAL